MVAVTITLFTGDSTRQHDDPDAVARRRAERARQRELHDVAGDHEPQLGGGDEDETAPRRDRFRIRHDVRRCHRAT